MRRGVGIAGIKHHEKAKEQFKAVGEEVKAASLVAMKDQLAVFRASLEEFARKHKDDIRRDPAFRAQFHKMCANVGVDPLVSNKGVWAELLGFGDFYYELGVQIVEACIATRPLNGGLIDLPSLLRYVQRRRGSQGDPITADDIMRAIKKLRVLGSGFDLVAIGSQSYVRSVPGELNMDKNKVLELAQGSGCLSKHGLQQRTGWQEQRAGEVLGSLLKEGLAMVDEGALDGVTLYWFPCTAGAAAGA